MIPFLSIALIVIKSLLFMNSKIYVPFSSRLYRPCYHMVLKVGSPLLVRSQRLLSCVFLSCHMTKKCLLFCNMFPPKSCKNVFSSILQIVHAEISFKFNTLNLLFLLLTRAAVTLFEDDFNWSLIQMCLPP